VHGPCARRAVDRPGALATHNRGAGRTNSRSADPRPGPWRVGWVLLMRPVRRFERELRARYRTQIELAANTFRVNRSKEANTGKSSGCRFTSAARTTLQRRHFVYLLNLFPTANQRRQCNCTSIAWSVTAPDSSTTVEKPVRPRLCGRCPVS